jgi:hypothetical protein
MSHALRDNPSKRRRPTCRQLPLDNIVIFLSEEVPDLIKRDSRNVDKIGTYVQFPAEHAKSTVETSHLTSFRLRSRKCRTSIVSVTVPVCDCGLGFLPGGLLDSRSSEL